MKRKKRKKDNMLNIHIAQARVKNEGKPVIGRRQINKLLKPYMLKKNNNIDIDGIDNALTSIDIYLNAVDKIRQKFGNDAIVRGSLIENDIGILDSNKRR